MMCPYLPPLHYARLVGSNQEAVLLRGQILASSEPHSPSKGDFIFILIKAGSGNNAKKVFVATNPAWRALQPSPEASVREC